MIYGYNILLTGNAGTGKSFLIKAFDQYCEENNINLVKTAPTGISAIIIGGATLHQQFKLSITLDLSQPRKYPEFLDKTDVLLIDEISMVRLDIFDKIMRLICMANENRFKNGKKNIQLIFSGDFFQLPPVIPKEEKQIINEYYSDMCGVPYDIGDGFCFFLGYFPLLDIKLRTLKTVMRQENEEYCAALDACKMGNVSCLPYFEKNCSSEPIEDAIWVCGKNASAKNINDEKLAAVNAPLLLSPAEYFGEVTPKDHLCEEIFHYKKGARVVMLKNGENYKNGSMGTIVGVSKNIIEVLFDNGKKEKITKIKFPKMEYGFVDEDGSSGLTRKLEKNEIGYAMQYPMRLGYAVTIHKSQGQTYDSMNLMPEIFANGQLYVALSRCKDAKRLHISTELTQRMLKCSRDVINFYQVSS